MKMSKVINSIMPVQNVTARYLHQYVIPIFISIFFMSCTTSNSSYIISEEDSLRKISNTNADGVVLDPPRAKYAPYTFVIDSNNNTYFYSLMEKRDGIGVFDDEEPDSIGLTPNQIFIIPRGTERLFFERNVLLLKSIRHTKNIVLASFKDTISNNFLSYLREISSDKTKNVFIRVRLALPEEVHVIRGKLNGGYYHEVK